METTKWKAVRCAAGGLLCLATSTVFAAQVLAPGFDDSDLVPSGKGWGQRAFPAPPRANPNAPGQSGKTSGNGIFYHGGPVILGGTNVYYIWYGNWYGNSADSILTNLAGNISGSPYFNINTTYYDGSNNHVSNKVTLSGSTTDAYSQGSNLSDGAVQAVVANAITSGALPKDTKGVYFVLTSSDVNETSGFCTQYCGWHANGTIGGLDIKYAFVGNPDRCPSACAWQSPNSPNNNAGADGMASIIAHELEEATTDPDLNAWYDRRGYENADKCAWTFGKTSNAPNGALYNVTLGGTKYLIQQNWVNAQGGYCAMSY